MLFKGLIYYNYARTISLIGPASLDEDYYEAYINGEFVWWNRLQLIDELCRVYHFDDFIMAHNPQRKEVNVNG